MRANQKSNRNRFGESCHPYIYSHVCACIIPVGPEVSKSSLQVVEQIHFLAALRAVDVQQLTAIQLAHLLRSLPSTAITGDTFFTYVLYTLPSD